MLNDKENSFAILIAPKRGDSLNLFLERCKSVFLINYLSPGENLKNKLQELEKYSNFDPDSDLLLFLEMKKIKKW